MPVRSKFSPLPFAALLVVLLAAAIATASIDQAQAARCNPTCLPIEGPSEEAPTGPKPRTMLVITVGWEGLGEPLPPSSSRSEALIDRLRGAAHESFVRQAAPKQFEAWQVSSGGSYAIQAPVTPPSRRDPAHLRACTDEETRQFMNEVSDRAEAKARQAGFDPGAYDNVVVGFPVGYCFGGLAQGRRLGIFNLSAIEHEFGHILGLGHSHGQYCRDAAGNRVPLSAKCEAVPYNDQYDVMGRGNLFSAAFANHLGWMDGQFFDLTAGEYTRTIGLKLFTAPAHAERAIRLHDGGQTLWIEYRTEIGFSPSKGVVIHRVAGSATQPDLQLLDMTPGSIVGEKDDDVPADATDAPLAPGRTWEDLLGEMKVTVNAVGPSAASVTIANRRITVPDVRGLEVERAYEILRSRGLNPLPFEGIVDPTCNLFGLIADQRPFPGERWLPENPVRLWVGEADPNPEHPCL